MNNLFIFVCFCFMWLMIFGVILYYVGLVNHRYIHHTLILGLVTIISGTLCWLFVGYSGMATVFLTNFIRCRTSFRMLFRLSLTMSLLGCDDLRQELTVKVRLPR